MKVYRILIIIQLAFFIWSDLYWVGFLDGQNYLSVSQEEAVTSPNRDVPLGPGLGVGIALLANLLPIYGFVCINSLYMNIKDDNLATVSSGAADNSGAINQQKAMVKHPADYDQPPSYNAYHEGQSSHVAIPMH